MTAPTPAPRLKLFGLVRDAGGRPLIDGDPNALAPQIKALLTPEDRAHLGMKETD